MACRVTRSPSARSTSAPTNSPAAPAPRSTNNPALGLRAIRLCLKEPELFYPQVRAILRASAFGPVRIMLPMLTSVWEIEQAERIIRQAMRHLKADGIAFDPDIPIGGMIEVPAAALNAQRSPSASTFCRSAPTI